MSIDRIPRRVAALLSVTMVVIGLIVGAWSFSRLPLDRLQAWSQVLPGAETSAGETEVGPNSAGSAPARPSGSQADPAPLQGSPPTATPTATPSSPILGLDAALPNGLQALLQELSSAPEPLQVAPADAVSVTVRLDLDPSGVPLYRYYFAAASRFDTVDPVISWQALVAGWRGDGEGTSAQAAYVATAVLSDTLPMLSQILGLPGPGVYGVGDREALLDAAWAAPPTLVLLPFESLTPELAVLAVDGQNPVENSHGFDPAVYPLVATVYGQATADPAELQPVAAALQAALGSSNRDPDRLTVVAMTGVTAMVRMTAHQMDQFGPAWPAEVIAPELSAADLTVVSNEVPFVPGCETDTSSTTLIFCSKPEYMATLEALGTDLIGLTGNHLNDYGRQASLESLEIYAAHGLLFYGGGRNKAEAFKPLYVEHNGNRLAFLGANSYGPRFAWATDNQPGSAEFEINIMSATIRSIVEKELADVVLAELQYQESYAVSPLLDQRQTFLALSRAGADIVTGIQSHVPQAIEFEAGRLILYGLGNLFFDQMWQQSTREGLIVKHTIYAGRHLSTQILTTLIYDFGQPHWTTPEERQRLLERVFAASYWER